MNQIKNEVSSKQNNSAKNNGKKRKTEQENIEDFAEKIHKLTRNKEIFTNISGTYFSCK